MRKGRDCLPTRVPGNVLDKIFPRPDGRKKDKNANFSLAYRSVAPRLRKHYCVPAFSNGIDFGVYNNGVDVLARAIYERVFFVELNGQFQYPPKPEKDIFEEQLLSFRSRFAKFVRHSTKLTPHQFVAKYSGRKRTMYEKARESLETRSLCDRDASIKVFTKFEENNFTAKVDPVPRVISPRDFRFNIELGVFLAPVEKPMYNIINKVFARCSEFPTIMSGMNMSQRGEIFAGKWRRFNKPVAVMMDAKRFDQHISRDALEWQHSMERLFYPGDDKLAWLLSQQIHNQGVGYERDGNVKFEVDGKRMSGDYNTGSGNKLIMCAVTYSFLASLNITEYEVVNEGDDCGIIMESKHLAAVQNSLESYYLRFGFSMVVEKPVFVIEEIEFCQSHPVFDGVNWVMVRNLSSVSKDMTCLIDWTNHKTALRWMKAVGMCGITLNGGIPCYQAIYSAYYRIAGNANPLRDVLDFNMKIKQNGMDRRVSSITPEARLSYYRAFGIPPENQISIERYYENLEIDLSSIVEDELIPRVMNPWKMD